MTDGFTEKAPERYDFHPEELTFSVQVRDVVSQLCEWLCPDQVIELLAQTYEKQGEDSLLENSLSEFIRELRLLRDNAKELQDRSLKQESEG